MRSRAGGGPAVRKALSFAGGVRKGRAFTFPEYDSPASPLPPAEAEGLTRRRFVGGALAAGGAAALVGPASALAAPKTRPAYGLDPCAGDCRSCNACESHAAAMLFARREDIRRAHVGCDCGVVERRLPFGTWVALYGHPEHMRAGEADRRDRRTAAILQTKL